MKSMKPPKAFPLEFVLAEGDEFTNNLLACEVVKDIQDLRTMLSMLEGDAPKKGHGYRTVWFRTQGCMLSFALCSDCHADRDKTIEHIDERVGL